MELRPTNSANYNEILRCRKKVVYQAIREIQQAKDSTLAAVPNDEDFHWEESNHPKKHNMESMSEIKKNIMATEELCGIAFLKYETALLSNDISPQGIWREVRTQLLILGWLKVTLAFIEDMTNPNNPSTLTHCSVESPNFATSEVGPLAEKLENDIPGLFERLKEYAQLAKDRSETIQAFSNLHKYCSVRPTPKGFVLEWQKLFEMNWSLKLCEYTMKVIDVVEISVDNRQNEFIRAASKLLEKLSDSNQSTEDRRDLLMELGDCATTFSR